jgi:hypothetical protein
MRLLPMSFVSWQTIPLDYRAGEKGRDKMYEGILSTLQGLEERLARSVDGQDAVGIEDTAGARTTYSI